MNHVSRAGTCSSHSDATTFLQVASYRCSVPVTLCCLHDNHTRIAFKPWTCKRCTCCVLYWLWPNDKRTDREGWLLPANTPNKNLSSLVKLVELNGDLSQRLASIHPTLNWWQNINRFSRLCIHVRVACEEHHVVNCTSREASAHWSVDGSLNSSYSYGGTFKAVTPRYQTERAQTMLTACAQWEITILKISGFDTLARQPSWGVLVVISSHPPPPPFFLFPGYSVLEAWRSIHLHHLHHPLDQETPLRSHGVQLANQDAHEWRTVRIFCVCDDERGRA